MLRRNRTDGVAVAVVPVLVEGERDAVMLAPPQAVSRPVAATSKQVVNAHVVKDVRKSMCRFPFHCLGFTLRRHRVGSAVNPLQELVEVETHHERVRSRLSGRSTHIRLNKKENYFDAFVYQVLSVGS